MVKDQGVYLRGEHLRPVLLGQPPSKPSTHLRFYLSPYFQPISLQLEARPGPDHTPRMQTGPSLQRMGPSRGMPLLQKPNRRPSLLSKLTLAPATFSYFSTASFIASMPSRRDTKTVMSSAYAETLARNGQLRRLHAGPDKPPHP